MTSTVVSMGTLTTTTSATDAASSGDTAGVTAMFEEVRGFLGDFTNRAMEQSSYMIDRLVERQ